MEKSISFDVFDYAYKDDVLTLSQGEDTELVFHRAENVNGSSAADSSAAD